MSLILKSLLVFDLNSDFNSKKVNILIGNDGNIKKISSHSIKTSATKTIDCNGMMVSPGWFDFRSNFCDPGYEHKEDLISGSYTAACSGFTDILLMPNTNPVLQSKNDISYVKNKTLNELTSVHPCAALTKNTDGIELNEILDLDKAGAIAFTDGEKEIQNSDILYKSLLYMNQFDGLLINKPRDYNLSKLGMVNEGISSTLTGIQGIPNIAEEIMIKRDLSILKYSGGKIHFSGISTKSSVDIIRKAKAEGLNVSCDVSIYNVLLDDSSILNFETNYKLDPPLRTKKDIDALIDGLIDGTIDVISSYHQPQNIENKDVELILKYNYPVWSNDRTPIGCVNKNLGDFPEKDKKALYDKYEGAVVICDSSGVIAIPKDIDTNVIIDNINKMLDKEDVWFYCLDELNHNTFEIICQKKYYPLSGIKITKI